VFTERFKTDEDCIESLVLKKVALKFRGGFFFFRHWFSS